VTAPETAGQTAGSGPLLTTSGLSVTFNVGSAFGARIRKENFVLRAVDGVDLEIERGEALAVVGESGSGKSTLARALTGIAPVAAGEMIFDGQKLAARRRGRDRRRIQMVFQDPYSSLNPRLTVGSILSELLKVHKVVPRSEVESFSRELLNLVGLSEEALHAYPRQFSGGQRQRVAIARALALRPDLLIADEPVSALDVSVQATILNLLRDLRAELGLTLMLISHNLAVVRHLCDRVAVMYLGRIVELGGRDDVFGRPLHPYTRALLSAAPVPDPEVAANRARIVLAGDLPSPAAPPPGCAFHTRCPFVRPTRCQDEVPALRSLDGGPVGHQVACHWAEEIVADAAARAAGSAPNAV